MKIILSGAMGHMGREVAQKAKQLGMEIAFGVDVCGGQTTFPIYTGFEACPEQLDGVIVDFSRPDGLEGLLDYAVRYHVPAVLATTGYSPAQEERVREAAQKIAIFHSANMSVGVALLRQLARKAAQVLGEAFDVEIVEAHHNRKVDAPSGTALMLYQAVKDEYEAPRELVCGRNGTNCKRAHNEIGMHSLRGGTVTGEHEVCFFGPAERVTLSHSAENRSIFATGALRAAAYIVDKAPGLYDMDQMIEM